MISLITLKLIGVAEAVVYLHERNIVHADLKLDNVLLTSGGEVKLTDFGLAKLLDPGLSTSVGMKATGTVCWQAPEVLKGSPRSKASDVWGFGMIIVELLTRKPPFWAPEKHLHTIIYDITTGHAQPSREHVDPGNAPPYWSQLWTVGVECWNEEPSKRPDMRSILDRLRVIQSHG